MNRNINLLYIIVLLLGCQSTNHVIKLNNTGLPVIIRYNKKYNFITRVNLPIAIEIKNNTPKIKSFIKIDYMYSPYSEGIGENIYNKNLVKIKNNKKKEINSFEIKDYIIYSWYRLDTIKSTQQQFKPYIEKMLSQNKDTLHIGTVSEFKKKHKELFEKLTKNDSISIQFLDGKKLGERITVPVKW